jgi:hypothetical protein
MCLQRAVLPCHNHTLFAGPAAGGAMVLNNVFGDPEDEPEK